VIRAGGGKDVVDAVDGEADRIRCGSGVDKARVDGYDSAEDCEKVVRPRSGDR
jgi:hypothetical protein